MHTSTSDLLLEIGPRLPLASDSLDEIRLGRSLAYVDDLVATMDEVWRVTKAGALVYARLPHASSSWSASRDPALKRPYTLETFDYFSPDRRNGRDAAAFEIERARLHLKGVTSSGGGVLVTVIESLANSNRGMQYRWERWFGPLAGGFEEFSIVLSTVKVPSI